MAQITKDFIFNLPKTDLHCHLDGSLRIDTLIELAKKHKIELFSYDPNALIDHLGYKKVRNDLNFYLKGFEAPLKILQDEDDIERAFFELAEDAFFENVCHLEIRYCPYLHQNKGLSLKEVAQSALRGSNKAIQKYGMSVGHILCGLKHDPMEKICSIAQLASDFKDQGVVAFDLAGPEVGFPITNYLAATQYAHDNLLNLTIHAGENSGPDIIYQAVINAHATRIGHGTALIQDKKLLDYVVNNRIAIESCPTSNIHTGSVKDLSKHPLKQFLDQGVLVCINTDNRLVSQTTMTQELYLVCKTFNLSLEQLKKLIENGFKAAFLPYEQKNSFTNKLNKAFNDL